MQTDDAQKIADILLKRSYRQWLWNTKRRHDSYCGKNKQENKIIKKKNIVKNE